MSSKVSITKTDTLTENHKLKTALQKLLAPWEGISNLVNSEDVVLLKPNLVLDVSYTQGAITNPYLIKALIELIDEQVDCKQIIIADGASVGNDTEDVFQKTEYNDVLGELLTRKDIKKVDFKQETFNQRQIETGQVIDSLYIPQTLEQADKIINLPVPKTHDALPATLGMKNMKGIIREGAKKKFHRIGLAQAIVDLNKAVAPDLTIYDATVAMEGLGPVHGTPVNWGILLSSKDVLAGDVVTAKLMEISKEEIDYLQLAEEQGVGVGNLDQIEIISEESLQQLSHSFARYKLDDSFYNEQGIRIEVEQSCSGCKHTLDGVVEQLEDEDILEDLAGKTIYMGPIDDEIMNQEEIILIGNCANNPQQEGAYIAGCPPHPEDLVEILKKVRRK